MKTHIMVHCSDTPDGPLLSWGAIERYHRVTKGWLDIGYHFGVEAVGTEFVALLGRPEHRDAAACYQQDMNKRAFHVCCVGDFDLVPPPMGMLITLAKRVVKPLMERYQIPMDNIVGHSSYATYKTCPGKKFDIQELKELLS